MTSELHALREVYEVDDLSWDERDVLLYALSVGAGQRDPYGELAFCLERPGHPPRVLPAFAATLAHRATEAAYAELELSRVVHAEQAVTLHRAVPPAGRARTTARVTGTFDKGSGALVVIDATTTSIEDGEPLFDTRSSVFLRGLGGFGGERGPSSSWSPPERPPDIRLTAPTRPDQALLYRLNGDRNPLHADPEFARGAGFERPILHGLCTYGIVARVLLHAACASDTARVRGYSARFSAPVFPGEELGIDAWEISAHEVAFRAFVGDRTVLDRGRLERA